MRGCARFFGAVSMLLVVAAVSGQSKPDFSGTWTQIKPGPAKTDVPLTVVQDATSITITWLEPRIGGKDRLSLKLDGTPGTYRFFMLDGTIQERRVTAEWSGTKLVMAHQLHSNRDGAYTMKRTWSLDGAQLVIDTAMTSDATGERVNEPFTQTFKKN